MDIRDHHIAKFYDHITEGNRKGKVACRLCPHNCILGDGQTGICKARKNINGDLFSLNYGSVASISLDPIEKKPLKHFHPGSMILSAGTFGCNLKCPFCQNWQISQEIPPTRYLSPEELVSAALDLRTDGNIGIAYTYNEPLIWYEYVADCSLLARQKGLVNVLVTNGYINEPPLRELLPQIDAMNIDLKAFTQSFYRNICKGSLEEVKNTISIAVLDFKIHVEVTTLVIPGQNDSEDEISDLAAWLSGISPEIPLHLSRFFPNFNMTQTSATEVASLRTLGEAASRHLKYVFIGNI